MFVVLPGAQGLFTTDDRLEPLNKQASAFCFGSRARTVDELLDFAASKVLELLGGVHPSTALSLPRILAPLFMKLRFGHCMDGL